MKNAHFITGATGFVGGAIALKLLEETNDYLVCLVRGDNQQDSQQRLIKSLIAASVAYNQPELEAAIMARCIAYNGDVTKEIPIEDSILGNFSVHTLWHSAASLKFSEKDKDFIYQMNVEGTKNVCAFSNTLGVKKTIYISTAYVSGKKQGSIKEEIMPLDNPTSNYYETSKIIAENHLVEHCQSKLHILRPSIVIGHSKTLAPTSFSGLYGFYVDVFVFRNKVKKVLGELLSYRPLQMISNPEDPLNLIPIDYVASGAVKIGLSDSDKIVFHLTNDLPCKVSYVVKNTFEMLELKAPIYVTDDSSFTSLDKRLDEHLEFYTSYLSGVKIFDRQNSLSVAGVYESGFFLDEDILIRFLEWYAGYQQIAGLKTRVQVKALNKLKNNPVNLLETTDN